MTIYALVLGCVTTVAVSWIFALGVVHPNVFGSASSRTAQAGIASDSTFIGVMRTDGLGVSAFAAATSPSVIARRPGAAVELSELMPKRLQHVLIDWACEVPTPALPTTFARGVVEWGFPFPAMRASFDQQTPRPVSGAPNPALPGTPNAGRLFATGARWFKARNGIVVRDAPATFQDGYALSPRELVLPTRIVWPGFVVDTVFWGAVWFAFLFLPRTLRTHARRRKNKCLACGYSRSSLNIETPCPECGNNPTQ